MLQLRIGDSIGFVTSILAISLFTIGCSKSDNKHVNSISNSTYAIASTNATQNETDDKNSIKIGALLTLNGSLGDYGNQLSKGIEIAVDNINEGGGINGHKIKVITVNTEGNTTVAYRQLQKLLKRDDICAVIGPVTTDEANAVMSQFDDYKTVGISPTASADGIVDGHPYGFRNTLIDKYATASTLKTMLKVHPEWHNVGIVYSSDTSYGVLLYNLYKGAVLDSGLNVIAEEPLTKQDVSYLEQVTNLRNANPDFVLYAGYYDMGASLFNEMLKQGFRRTVVGGDGIANSKISELTNGEGDGLIFGYTAFSGEPSTPNNKLLLDLMSSHNATSNTFLAVAYESLALILAPAMKNANISDCSEKSRMALREAIYNKTFEALDGNITFDNEGNGLKDAVVVELQNVGGKLEFAPMKW